jgi:hypothetical protein
MIFYNYRLLVISYMILVSYSARIQMCAAVLRAAAAAASLRLPITTAGMCGVTLGCASLILVPASVDRFQNSNLSTGIVTSESPGLVPALRSATAQPLLGYQSAGSPRYFKSVVYSRYIPGI